MRMLAEAARIQAEINRQKAEKEYRDQSQTAVLYACQVQEQSDDAVRKEYEEAKLRAETAAKKAEEEFRKASAESERLAEEVRAAREEEMRAEEARMRAEYEARRNYKEAEKLGKLLAENGFDLVYGGSCLGLMWACASQMKETGG